MVEPFAVRVGGQPGTELGVDQGVEAGGDGDRRIGAKPDAKPSSGDAEGKLSGFSPLTLTVLLTGLGAALRFSGLERQSFWYDEAVSVNLARASLADLFSGRVRDLGNPPLFPALLHLWTAVFGFSDTAVRALPALFGTLALPVTLALARRVFPERVAFLGGTLLALAPFHLQMAQEARAYTLLAFLGALTGLALVRALQAETTRGGSAAAAPWWVLLAVATGAMALTHYFGLFLAVAQAIYVGVVHRRHRRVLIRTAGSYLAAALIFSFWIPSLAAQLTEAGNLARSVESWHLHLLATPLVFSLGTTLIWKDAVGLARAVLAGGGAVAFAAMALVGLTLTVRRPALRQNPYSLLLLLWLTVPVAIPALLSLVVSPLYNTRYVILASLPFILFVAAGLEELKPRGRALMGALIVAAMAASTLSYLSRPVKHQWREAAAFIEAVRRPGDLLLFDADYNETAYAHYAGPGQRRIRLLAPPAGFVELGAATGKLFGAHHEGAPTVDVSPDVAAADRVWLILADERPGVAERARAFLGRPPARVAVPWKAHAAMALRGITLQLYERPRE